MASSTRGAYLRDDDPPPAGFGCQTSASTTPKPVYIGCNYPPTYSYTDSNGNSISYNATPPDPNGMSATPTQYMGQYTLFIRQDLGECRQGSVTIDNNGIVVIRSEGTASDNRTKVVLEVTMSTNPNVAILSQGIATVCPAGAAGLRRQRICATGYHRGPPWLGRRSGSGGSGGAAGAAGCDTNCNGGILLRRCLCRQNHRPELRRLWQPMQRLHPSLLQRCLLGSDLQWELWTSPAAPAAALTALRAPRNAAPAARATPA